MIALLFLYSQGFAETGRATAAWFGTSPRSGFTVRGGVDYGAVRRLSLAAEAGWGGPAATLSAGVRLDAIDGHWWRVGAVVLPGIAVSGADHASPTGVLDVGLRASWLAFWGLSFVGRVDRLETVDGSGWTEIGGGLGVRL